jgi:hypothetical protein
MGISRMSLTGSHVSPQRADRWLVPHQPLDPSVRRATYGPIKPMDWTGPSFLGRLFHWG